MFFFLAPGEIGLPLLRTELSEENADTGVGKWYFICCVQFADILSKGRCLGGNLKAGSRDICQIELKIIHVKEKMLTEPDEIYRRVGAGEGKET